MLYIYYKTYFNNGIIKEIDYKKKKILNITHFLFYIVNTSIYMRYIVLEEMISGFSAPKMYNCPKNYSEINEM